MSSRDKLVQADLDAADGRLIRIVRDTGSITRAGLIQATGWARATVARRVDSLLELGLLTRDGSARSSGGRPASLVNFNRSAGTILAADLGITHSRVAAVDLLGNAVAEPTDVELDLSRGPDQAMPDLFAVIGHQASQAPELPLAVVMGLPAPIDAATGRPTNPPILSSWHDYPLREKLHAEFGVPAFIEKDTNLMALGEQRGAWPTAQSLVYVKVGTGIGSGVVLGGELYRGATGSAGDIGHIQIDGNQSTLCRCGRHGCLEAVAGGAALSARMRALGRDAESSRDVTALVHAGDSEAKALVRDAGRQIGEVLASVVSFANPDVVVLGGDLGAEPLLLGAARAEILRRPLELATRDLKFVASSLSVDAGIRGAAALSIDRLWPSR
jgi:predicted NBD/HSP70 family sugar kinase